MDVFEKMLLGQSLDDFTRLPGIDETIHKLEQSILSGFPLRTLGISDTQGEVLLAEEDRDKMIKMMYGGDLSDREVSYALSQLKKQNAVIKINKQPPVSMRLTDVPDIQMPAKELADWKAQHYKSNPWYRSIQSVREEINSRFAIQTATPKSASSGRRANPQTNTGEQVEEPSAGTRPASPIPQQILDDIANSPTVLRDKKRRQRSKDHEPPPKTR